MDYSDNIGFYREGPYGNNTLKTEIKETTGYYILGSACGIPGGCNNYAPYWQYIKLWKNRPLSPEDRADINFKMVFQ